jgi:hypothetical protein
LLTSTRRLFGKRRVLHMRRRLLVSLTCNVQIEPSEILTWLPCYKNKECARLAVPLDYANPSDSRASIALLKVPSRIPLGQKGYRGPIIFNPGALFSLGVLRT